MDLHICASLDASTAGGTGNAVAGWFGEALSGLVPELWQREEQGDQVSSLATTQKDEQSRDERFEPVSQNWPSMKLSLHDGPETADVLFFVTGGDGPVCHINGSSISVRRPNMELSIKLDSAVCGTDADRGSRIVDFLAASLNDVNPAFGRVDSTGPWDAHTNLDAVLRRRVRRSVNEARTFLRGYSWITVCPEELSRRLGGPSALAASGAFSRVVPLAAGGVVLQATETLTGFTDDALRRVFRALAPVLPPGMPQYDPADPNVRYIPEDASTV
ncbi:DUF3396 domain-containing protein [Streptomyces olivochromogenes]|uniref:DUF3396 domain-containing protein n=1 Tax=Streptomyces olivochromogenes TaxID=1963 RepID=UPI001F1A1CA4|nr:DUF3396 domain-containing protein [Streptomyces olivochromogenes]MCF3131962.1 hypothetical protein [Streptomyces olivochromogenes]